MTIYYAIVEGDPLDNGGNSRVIGGADHSTIEGPDGRERKQAHLGQEAWCSVCQAFGPILSGAGIRESLRGWDERLQAFEAVSGDIVLCKCPQHPRVVARYARSCEYIDNGDASFSTSWTSYATAGRARHDEQFTLTDVRGNALADTYYTVRMPDGVLIHCTTDSTGRTARHVTEGAQKIAIYLGHRE
ncbi:PAAR domain-containing protein [Paraburkholderia sp. J76]|uniref:PAAR domain-containing protein n=1 Tax=Paraburkholderia sp. J76 TaxID=2805439 RepID=UPI002ABE785B|nr:PAAR domain-containing protein [Paraburkholderia sp. J76]